METLSSPLTVASKRSAFEFELTPLAPVEEFKAAAYVRFRGDVEALRDLLVSE